MTAFETMARVEPQWIGLTTAAEAVGLETGELLHAGPPFDGPGEVPPVIRNAAAQSCVYEGWASDFQTALAMIDAGSVRLGPAQDRNLVTPLAEVVSPSTTVQAVRCANDPAREAWSPLTSGAAALPRFGTADPGVLQSMRYRDHDLRGMLSDCLAEPIALKGIARAGLENGDDLHAMTDGATASLAGILAARAPSPGHAEALTTFFSNTPLFFLSLWMAGCKVLLRSIEGMTGPGTGTLVTTIAANGVRVGVKLAGNPSAWVVGPSSPPEGPRIPGKEAPAATPAVGDSAIVDALGFGGQALGLAPKTVAALGAFLPEDWRGRVHAAMGPSGMLFPGLEFPFALDAARVGPESGPVMLFGMLDASGEAGLLGRGVYLPTAQVFRDACGTLWHR